MLGELVLGHVFTGGGDFPKTKNVSVGLLGADYEIMNDHYRFKKNIFRPELEPRSYRAAHPTWHRCKTGTIPACRKRYPARCKKNKCVQPLPECGRQANKDHRERFSVYAKCKDFIVIPVTDETGLRRMDWVEQPQKVDSLSGGRIAYVYLPNTADGGYDYFNRYFFSQLNKDAVIADDRTNMGGYAADYIVDLLGRKTVMRIPTSAITSLSLFPTRLSTGQSNAHQLPCVVRWRPYALHVPRKGSG